MAKFEGDVALEIPCRLDQRHIPVDKARVPLRCVLTPQILRGEPAYRTPRRLSPERHEAAIPRAEDGICDRIMVGKVTTLVPKDATEPRGRGEVGRKVARGASTTARL